MPKIKAEKFELNYLNNTLHKHARTMPRAMVKRLVKHWGILKFGSAGNKSYTLSIDGSYAGKVVKEGDLWRATKLQSDKDLFSEYKIVIRHKKLYEHIKLCAAAEQAVIIREA